jgi:hypothetical protein
MRVLMGFGLVPRVFVIMGAVIACVVMIMGVFISSMGVFVRMFMTVGVTVVVAVSLVAVLVLMLVAVFVGMLMCVFVFSFHGIVLPKRLSSQSKFLRPATPKRTKAAFGPHFPARVGRFRPPP